MATADDGPAPVTEVCVPRPEGDIVVCWVYHTGAGEACADEMMVEDDDLLNGCIAEV